MHTTLTSKGQMTLPSAVRTQLGLEAGESTVGAGNGCRRLGLPDPQTGRQVKVALDIKIVGLRRAECRIARPGAPGLAVVRCGAGRHLRLPACRPGAQRRL